MEEKQNKPTECQAFDCDGAATDDMGLFCDAHWAMIPADVRGTLESMYDDDPETDKHVRWVREVRKVVAFLMAGKRDLKRNKDGKNLDEFPKDDPFLKKEAEHPKIIMPGDNGKGGDGIQV